MEQQLEKIRDVQRDAWNKSSSGWKKWDDRMMDFLKPMNKEIIQMLKVKDDDIILDVATGTGEPALTIATLVKSGKVIGTDLSEAMLIVAKEKAEKNTITNFETVCCDVSELPFENDMFDSISCRLGFMFFPDIQVALQEMIRVLKPGGRIVASVWCVPERNSWIKVFMETMISKLELKPPSPGSPGLFRCAGPGFMADHFKQAGLKNIQENPLEGKLKCENIETYWSFMTEVASPVAFGKAEDALKEEIKEEVVNKVKQRSPGETVELESFSLVICGEKG